MQVTQIPARRYPEGSAIGYINSNQFYRLGTEGFHKKALACRVYHPKPLYACCQLSCLEMNKVIATKIFEYKFKQFFINQAYSSHKNIDYSAQP